MDELTKRILVDFDGVISADVDSAKEVLSRWKEKGIKIIIYTARCRRHEKDETESLLRRWKIPYDELVLNKPEGDVIIDDRALEFKSWTETYRRLKCFVEEPHEYGKIKW